MLALLMTETFKGDNAVINQTATVNKDYFPF